MSPRFPAIAIAAASRRFTPRRVRERSETTGEERRLERDNDRDWSCFSRGDCDALSCDGMSRRGKRHSTVEGPIDVERIVNPRVLRKERCDAPWPRGMGGSRVQRIVNAVLRVTGGPGAKTTFDLPVRDVRPVTLNADQRRPDRLRERVVAVVPALPAGLVYLDVARIAAWRRIEFTKADAESAGARAQRAEIGGIHL